MRAMAVPTRMTDVSSCNGTGSQGKPGSRITAWRPWVQTGFLLVWLAPAGRWLHGFPACVFHCYACPLSSFGCPVGLAAQYAATLPAWGTMPFLLAGIILGIGGLVGTLACGWACPFGFLQDLLARVMPQKISLPSWMGQIRYIVLIGLVFLLPWYLGREGILYDEQAVSICRLCPAGALEAGVYYSVASLLAGNGWIMSWYKAVILVVFLGASLIINRPWCRIFCPLGGVLALFNKSSVFHLRFEKTGCVECNACRSRCPFDVKLDLNANTRDCVRCLECTACRAIKPVCLRR